MVHYGTAQQVNRCLEHGCFRRSLLQLDVLRLTRLGLRVGVQFGIL